MINAAWFQRHFQNKNLTQRVVSERLKISASAFSQILSGKRRLRMNEAVELARLLQVPLEEVLASAGLKTGDLTGGDRKLEVEGWVDAGLNVVWGPVKGPKTALKPPLTGKSIEVVRAQTAGSPMQGIDGALLYYQKSDGVDLNADNGKLALVKVVDGKQERWRLGVVRKSYQPGRADILSLNGEAVAEEVLLGELWPVVWMKF